MESSLSSSSTSLVLLLVLVTILVVAGVVAFIFYPAWAASGQVVSEAHCQTFGVNDTSIENDDDVDKNNDKSNIILLSIIIPAYNEEERLATMLKAAQEYLSTPHCRGLQLLQRTTTTEHQNNHKKKGELSSSSSSSFTTSSSSSVEWIVVNDGSKDQTTQVYESYATEQIRIQRQQSNKTNNNNSTTRMIWRLCSLSRNSGKGAAVRAGMMLASGRYCLMADADGATEFGKGLEALAAHAPQHEFCFGSRSAAKNTSTSDKDDDGKDDNDETTIQRSWIRRLLQAAFHAFVVLIVGNASVQDTQCGFKLFWGNNSNSNNNNTSQQRQQQCHGTIARALFSGLHLHRWSFDIELFVRAKELGLSLKEVGVPWKEVDGSKLNTGTLALIRVGIGMLRDMICVRLCYTLGIWKMNQQQHHVDNDDSLSSSGEKKKTKKEQ